MTTSPKLVVVACPDLPALPPAPAAGGHRVTFPLSRLLPPISELTWTTAVTGVSPFHHGIHGAHELSPHRDGILAARSTSRQVPTLCELLAGAGRTAHSVHWPVTHPAETRFAANGTGSVCVSPTFARLPARAGDPWPLDPESVHPSDCIPELSDLRLRPEDFTSAAIEPFLPHWRDIDPARDTRITECAVALAETATIQAVATYLAEERPADLLMASFPAPGRLLRRFGPGSSPVKAMDTLLDLMLARLLHLSGASTTLVLLSETSARITGPLAPSLSIPRTTTLLDLVPTVLALLGLPMPSYLEGEPWTATPFTRADISPRRPLAPKDDDADIAHLLALGYRESLTDPLVARLHHTRQQNRQNLADSLIQARQFAEGAAVLETLLAAAPGDLSTGQRLFELYMLLDQPGRARDLAERATTLPAPAAGLGHLGLAIVANEQRQPALAAEHAQAAVAMLPDQPHAHYQHALAQIALRQPAAAADSFEAALRLDPSLLPAHRHLEHLYRGPLADPVRAQHHWRCAHELLLQRRLAQPATRPRPLHSDTPCRAATPSSRATPFSGATPSMQSHPMQTAVRTSFARTRR